MIPLGISTYPLYYLNQGCYLIYYIEYLFSGSIFKILLIKSLASLEIKEGIE